MNLYVYARSVDNPYAHKCTHECTQVNKILQRCVCEYKYTHVRIHPVCLINSEFVHSRCVVYVRNIFQLKDRNHDLCIVLSRFSLAQFGLSTFLYFIDHVCLQSHDAGTSKRCFTRAHTHSLTHSLTHSSLKLCHLIYTAYLHTGTHTHTH